MSSILLYLLESTICLTVLYPVYWFFLRRDTFFHMNRFYLLAMVFFSMFVPMLPLHLVSPGPPSSILILLEPVLITPEKLQKTLSDHIQWIEIAAIVYFTGSLIFFLRFALQLIQLYRITRRFGIRESHGQRVVFVDHGYSPFSFFNLVFINKEVIPAGSLPVILEHERVHIRQHHTIDMILVELAAILQWFNPIIWLTGREMKSIHEYLADEGVLQTGINRSQYQQMILDETMGIQVNSLTNNFNVSLLKKRITMMTKSKSGTWAKSKMLLALPALAALLFLLPVTSVSSSSDRNNQDKNQSAPVFVMSQAAIPVAAGMEPQDPVSKPTEKKVFTKVENPPQYPGGDDARIKFIMANIKYPEEARKLGIQGTVPVTFVVQANGTITDVKVIRNVGGGCDEEAVRIVKMMPNWIPGMDKGKNVAVQFNLPFKFALDNDKKKEQKK